MNIYNVNKVNQINSQNLFRLPYSYHQKYKTVTATEDDFATHINWQHELDEMIRLIGSEGKIVIKCGNSLSHNMFSVKNYLGRRLGIEVKIEEESPLWAQKMYKKEKWSKDDYCTTATFHIKRKNLEIYQDKSWTFAILTLGNKIEDVKKFCALIRDLDKKCEHQILIFGPKNSAYDQYKVDYINDRIQKKYQNDQHSRICEKKNIIIDNAKNQNLLICHDRYYLDKNFFKGFEKYGYDFDFLSIDTAYEDKNIWFPHYVKMSNFIHNFAWNKERFCFKRKDFAKNNALDNIFINGGLMIFKRDIVKQIRFNECNFHYQIEDVEITKEFAKYHIPPRVNLFSKAYTSNNIANRVGKDLSYQDQYICAGGRIIKRKKKNLYKRLRRMIFKLIYNIVSNKRFINFLEKKIF
ncbi:hypothetical protein N9O56_00010 [Rickettsiales bacterium]|nr:hypothetical protein [Rickettsiales bacterium]